MSNFVICDIGCKDSKGEFELGLIHFNGTIVLKKKVMFYFYYNEKGFYTDEDPHNNKYDGKQMTIDNLKC